MKHLVLLFIFSSGIFFSCHKKPCEKRGCVNGTCIDDSCICNFPYSGSDCATKWVPKKASLSGLYVSDLPSNKLDGEAWDSLHGPNWSATLGGYHFPAVQDNYTNSTYTLEGLIVGYYHSPPHYMESFDFNQTVTISIWDRDTLPDIDDFVFSFTFKPSDYFNDKSVGINYTDSLTHAVLSMGLVFDAN